jgi:hypothetical protein
MNSWLLLGASSEAQETPQVEEDESSSKNDALEKKLLGPIEEVPVSEPLPDVQMTDMYKWMFPFAAILILIVVLNKWKKGTPLSPGEIRVTSKQPMGREGSIAIIEVGSIKGKTKRLLIGLHDNSAPRLIDRLDEEQQENFDSFLDRVEQQHGNNSNEPKIVTKHNEPQIEKPVLQDRKELISEIYQARGIDESVQPRGLDQYRRAANELYPENTSESVTPVEVQEDEDPWAAKFRLIYSEKTRDE